MSQFDQLGGGRLPPRQQVIFVWLSLVASTFSWFLAIAAAQDPSGSGLPRTIGAILCGIGFSLASVQRAFSYNRSERHK
jgi:hypothetical protein